VRTHPAFQHRAILFADGKRLSCSPHETTINASSPIVELFASHYTSRSERYPWVSEAVGPVVTVGGGLGGLRTAGALRLESYEGKLSILAAESRPPYTRPPLSKQVRRGRRSADEPSS
jgi:hypothetical protein